MSNTQQTIPAGSDHHRCISLASLSTPSQVAEGASCESRATRRFFRKGVAALCGMGLLVVAFTLLLMPVTDLRTVTRGGMPSGGWVLQVLVTGNLAVGLLWIWLDRLARRSGIAFSATREKLSTVALLVMGGITLFCLVLGGEECCHDILGMALCLACPTLAVTLPMLWLTVRRLESERLEALILIAFVAASAFVQGSPGDSPATEGEHPFVMNSCLIGMAVAVWLVTWAASPEARRAA